MGRQSKDRSKPGVGSTSDRQITPAAIQAFSTGRSIGRDHKTAADGVELVVTWPEWEVMGNLSESQSLLRAVQRSSPSFH